MFTKLFILMCSLSGAFVAYSQESSDSEKKFIEAVEDELDANGQTSTPPSSNKKVIVRKKITAPHQTQPNAEASSDEDQRGARRHTFLVPDRQYGQYKTRIGMLRPEFDGDIEFYEELYGNTKWYPTISVDWIPWDGPVGLGLGFRFGYYSDRGYAVRSAPVAGQSLDVDKNQSTRLRLYPLQVVLAGQFSPFSQKWVGIDGWIGYEHLFYTETRLGSDDSTANDLYVNEGSNKNVVYGGAINILLNPLDEHSAAVLSRGMGIGYIYLTYIYEMVRPLKDSDSGSVDLSRTSQGVALSFETSL